MGKRTPDKYKPEQGIKTGASFINERVKNNQLKDII